MALADEVRKLRDRLRAQTPNECQTNCPFCGGLAEATFIDVGVGFPGPQVSPFVCMSCGAEEMDPKIRSNHEALAKASLEEVIEGWWYGPGDA